MSPKVSFVVPCLNEEKNVVPTLDAIKQCARELNLDCEIVVIDDCSRDRTSAVVQEYMAKSGEGRVHLHKNEKTSGLGFTYMKGARLARGEYFMAVFGDHSESKQGLKNILSRMGQAEMVVPYLENPKEGERRPLSRRIVSGIFVRLIGFLSTKRLKYYNGPVLHRRENILECREVGTGFGYQAELLSQLLLAGHSYVEVPCPFHNRVTGGSAAFKFSNMVSVAGSLYRILKCRLTAR